MVRVDELEYRRGGGSKARLEGGTRYRRTNKDEALIRYGADHPTVDRGDDIDRVPTGGRRRRGRDDGWRVLLIQPVGLANKGGPGSPGDPTLGHLAKGGGTARCGDVVLEVGGANRRVRRERADEVWELDERDDLRARAQECVMIIRERE